jgi:ABC-2 type transport system ATP-binding protein
MKIEVKNITKTFNTGKNPVHALTDVSFKIEPGQIFGFVGSNGAGKSTTMRTIMGVLSEDNGQILLDDEPATSSKRKKIGYMPAERGLYPKMKVLKQLVFFGEIHGLSKKVATDQAMFWMNKLDITKYEKSALETLSTGNQQKVQLAVALVSNPNSLVLDEPFSGLDPIAVQSMITVINEFAANGGSVLFSSHQLELVDEVSDIIGIIQDGKMVMVGTPDELRKSAGGEQTVTIPKPLASIFGHLITEKTPTENAATKTTHSENTPTEATTSKNTHSENTPSKENA